MHRCPLFDDNKCKIRAEKLAYRTRSTLIAMFLCFTGIINKKSFPGTESYTDTAAFTPLLINGQDCGYFVIYGPGQNIRSPPSSY